MAHSGVASPCDPSGPQQQAKWLDRTLLKEGDMSPTGHAVLLGLPVVETPQLVPSVQRGRPYSSYDRLLATGSRLRNPAWPARLR
jgi:hypothetical protein